MLTLPMAQRSLLWAIELLISFARNARINHGARIAQIAARKDCSPRKHCAPLVEIDSTVRCNHTCAENEIKLPSSGATHASRAVAQGTCPQSVPIASWRFEAL